MLRHGLWYRFSEVDDELRERRRVFAYAILIGEPVHELGDTLVRRKTSHASDGTITDVLITLDISDRLTEDDL